jgi:hypothetical protein
LNYFLSQGDFEPIGRIRNPDPEPDPVFVQRLDPEPDPDPVKMDRIRRHCFWGKKIYIKLSFIQVICNDLISVLYGFFKIVLKTNLAPKARGMHPDPDPAIIPNSNLIPRARVINPDPVTEATKCFEYSVPIDHDPETQHWLVYCFRLKNTDTMLCIIILINRYRVVKPFFLVPFPDPD